MKKLEELGVSPEPWKYVQKSGYNRESGEFNTSDAVCDAEGEVLLDFWNGETYGEVHPNAENDARLIAAAPKLYKKAYEVAENLLAHLAVPTQTITMNRTEIAAMSKDLLAALAEAAGETR